MPKRLRTIVTVAFFACFVTLHLYLKASHPAPESPAAPALRYFHHGAIDPALTP